MFPASNGIMTNTPGLYYPLSKLYFKIYVFFVVVVS